MSNEIRTLRKRNKLFRKVKYFTFKCHDEHVLAVSLSPIKLYLNCIEVIKPKLAERFYSK